MTRRSSDELEVDRQTDEVVAWTERTETDRISAITFRQKRCQGGREGKASKSVCCARDETVGLVELFIW